MRCARRDDRHEIDRGGVVVVIIIIADVVVYLSQLLPKGNAFNHFSELIVDKTTATLPRRQLRRTAMGRQLCRVALTKTEELRWS